MTTMTAIEPVPTENSVPLADGATFDAQVAKHLATYVPNPYTARQWYPAEFGNRRFEVAVTHGKGRKAGSRYLHVRKRVDRVFRDLDGTVISREPNAGFLHFRIELDDPNATFTQL